jgi:hypothetical protein
MFHCGVYEIRPNPERHTSSTLMIEIAERPGLREISPEITSIPVRKQGVAAYPCHRTT